MLHAETIDLPAEVLEKIQRLATVHHHSVAREINEILCMAIEARDAKIQAGRAYEITL